MIFKRKIIMKKIALLGSTGSIGRQVLQVVDRYPDQYQIISLAAGKNAKLLSEQIQKYKPETAALTDPENAFEIASLPQKTTLYTGENALLHCILPDADVIFVAVTGFCGFIPVIEALKMGKTVALANKESLIAGGELIEKVKKEHGSKIIPVDSEHSAIWQALAFEPTRPYKRIVLTASGGALRDVPIEKLPLVTKNDALKHPNWKMGDKITIDCATMFNKGLEVIEAMWLYNAPLEKIEVLIHPQSIVHSLVEYADNALIAQLSAPSMEIPIQLALTYPEREYAGVAPLDLTKQPLEFFKPDLKRYPCFSLALSAAKKGGIYPCAISAANEEAVKLFLADKIGFCDIEKYLENALNKATEMPVTLQNLIFTDYRARASVYALFKENKN